MRQLRDTTRTAPSGRTIRYSPSVAAPELAASRKPAATRGRSSGWMHARWRSGVGTNAPGAKPAMRKSSSDQVSAPVAWSYSQLPRCAIRCASARPASLTRIAASASTRAVISRNAPIRWSGRPSSARSSRDWSCTTRTVPSGCTTRYSRLRGAWPVAASSAARSTRSRSSGSIAARKAAYNGTTCRGAKPRIRKASSDQRTAPVAYSYSQLPRCASSCAAARLAALRRRAASASIRAVMSRTLTTRASRPPWRIVVAMTSIGTVAPSARTPTAAYRPLVAARHVRRGDGARLRREEGEQVRPRRARPARGPAGSPGRWRRNSPPRG